MSRPIKSFIDAWTSAKPNKAARNDTAISVWYDWFCSDEGLYNRTIKFVHPLKRILEEVPGAKDFSASGKNCCPLSGPLYDVLRIFDGDEFVCYMCFDDARWDHRFQVETATGVAYDGDDREAAIDAMIVATKNYITNLLK